MTDIAHRLRAACDGHPHANIPWPHRVLHEAADEIERLREALWRIEMIDVRPGDIVERFRAIARTALAGAAKVREE